MFEQVSAAPADPILGLTEAFNKDTRANKINLGVGIYKDENGATPILGSVKAAEKILLDTETSKSYLSIEGLPEYGQGVQRLLFGADHAIVKDGLARTAHCPGGTGALRIAAEFMVRQLGVKRIWVSNPTWANHGSVFRAAGLEVAEYTYYNAETHDKDFAGMKAALAQVPAGDAVLFHGCCHNPTGIDPTADEWKELADMAANAGWVTLFDFAYQGFARGIEEDAQGLRVFLEKNPELLIASSFSKNFGLYNERVGAFTLVAKTPEVADSCFSQVKAIIRANYSNPPFHGAGIVTTVLGSEELTAQWEQEVADMRDRIQAMRDLFVQTLKDKGVTQDFSFIARQNGMFSFSGLSKEQVARLKDEFGIYIVGSGRISVAGMTRSNMDALCSAIAQVL
ncbi:MAG: aspartate/tyrosine/aromatic aminotransferase [Gammaproteobacteria bacterium]|nr:MAG: aspartate/tyrosine/aromatic aminotransferase [Gammaproteobacteria bacterium]